MRVKWTAINIDTVKLLPTKVYELLNHKYGEPASLETEFVIFVCLSFWSIDIDGSRAYCFGQILHLILFFSVLLLVSEMKKAAWFPVSVDNDPICLLPDSAHHGHFI